MSLEIETLAQSLLGLPKVDGSGKASWATVDQASKV